MVTPNRNSQDTVSQLAKQIARLEESERKEKTGVSSGCRPLDRLLPGGGFARGSLIEWLEETPGSGAFTLALLAAVEACREGGVCVVVDQNQLFYPPAAVGWGLKASQLVVVRPTSDRDETWALTQVLRCRHVAAVVCRPNQLDAFAYRRLQLAAEVGGAVGSLIRPARVRKDPTWAKVRLLVTSSDACLDVTRPELIAASKQSKDGPRVVQDESGLEDGTQAENCIQAEKDCIQEVVQEECVQEDRVCYESRPETEVPVELHSVSQVKPAVRQESRSQARRSRMCRQPVDICRCIFFIHVVAAVEV